jgi:NADH-quinone oxidoreductase subunit G
VLGMAGRSRERHPSVLTEALDLSKCISCGQCAVVCPVGAITERSEWRQVQEELDAQRKARGWADGASAAGRAVGAAVCLHVGASNVVVPLCVSACLPHCLPA